MKAIFSILISFVLLATAAVAQTPPAPLTGEQVVEVVAPSVALVLVGNDAGELTGTSSAAVVRADGVLLTAYHAIKQAQRVQLRFKNGEIYDQVQLIGADERRDVAALRIVAANLPAVAAVNSSESKAGMAVFVLSNGAGLPWTASSGVLFSIRLADEAPERAAATAYCSLPRQFRRDRVAECW
jgi:S1-C subfamily serine protease